MTQLTNGRTGAKALFEAGDRPTDQNFTNLFDSILFLGESNLVSQTLTSISNNFSVGGSLSSGGAFIVDNIVMFGKASGEEQHDKPLQVYGEQDETIIFASGSISNVLFEGISGDVTSSIKLTDSTATVGFGTYGNKGFLSVHNEEIITYSTGSSAGDNIIYMSGSLGIGEISPSYTLDVNGEGRFGVHSGILLTDDSGTSFVKALNNHLNLFTSRDQDDIFFTTGTTPTIKMLIEGNTGNVGIGTTGPGEKLEIVGNFAIRNAADNVNVMLFSNANSVTTHPNIQFNGSAQLAADDDFNINIDSNGSGTNAKFSIKKDDIDTNGIEIFKVTEAGQVSGSSFIGDGSGLTNITAGNITGFVTDGVDNRVLTAIDADSIQGEENLTFDGSKLGVNTNSPKQALHVHGNIMLGDNASDHFIHSRDSLGLTADKHVFISSDANDTSGTGGSDIIFGYGSAVDLNSTPTSTFSNAFPSSAPRVELMRIDASSGNIGIGTSSPQHDLHVHGGASNGEGGTIKLSDYNNYKLGGYLGTAWDNTTSGYNFIYLGGSYYDGTNWITNEAAQWGSSNISQIITKAEGIYLITAQSVGNSAISENTSDFLENTSMFINSDGDVGIGTSAPGHKLHISDSTDPTLKIDPGSSTTENPTIKLTGPGETEGHHIVYQNADGITRFDNIYDGSAADIRFRTRVNGTANNNLTLDGNGYVGINQTSPQNMLHVRVDTTSVGTSHDNDIGILIQQDGDGDAGIEFETSDQYWSIFNDNSQNDFVIRDITNSRTLATFTNAGNVILAPGGNVYGRSQTDKSTKLYRFHGLYLTWDSANYGTQYSHSITSTNGTEGTDGSGGDSITINSYNNILMNIDSNDNSTSTFKIGHKTTDTANILFTLDETGLITTTNTIKMADTSNYWLATGGSTNWGLYWDTGNNHLEWRGDGNTRGYVDLETGNTVFNGWMYIDYARLTEAPGGATTGEVRLGAGTSNSLKVQTPQGYVNFGPQNSGWCHFYTDAGGFYFDKDVTSNGDFTSYDDDAYLRRLSGGDNYVQILSGYSRFVVSGTEQFRVDTNSVNLFNNKKALSWNEYTNDNWFRINSSGEFTDGTYFGSEIVRTDGELQVGSGGGSFRATTSAITLAKTTTATTTFYSNTGVYAGDTTDYRRMYFSQSTKRLNFNRKGVTNSVYIENGDNSGQIKTTFTGQHKNQPSSNLSNFVGKKGHIVVSTGVYSNIPENRNKQQIEENNTEVLTNPTMNESLPTVEFSTTSNDKRVWGVLSDWDDPDTTISEEKPMYGGMGTRVENRVDDRLVINSLGEGAIMVSNYNGNFENGDYITTSPIEGIGMKQDDDLLHNYTVAKITQDEDFSSGTTTVGSTYKGKLVGCTYHCG